MKNTTQKHKKNKVADSFDIEKHIDKCDISYRGGRLTVDVSDIFVNVDDARMGASQSYLGGGIAGAIVGGANFEPSELSKKEQVIFHALLERIKVFFYNANNGGGDEYMQENVTGAEAKGGYGVNQKLPARAY